MMIIKNKTISKNIMFFFIIYISLFFLILTFGDLVSTAYCQDNFNLGMQPTESESIVLGEFRQLIESTENARFHALFAKPFLSEINTTSLEQTTSALNYINFNITNILGSHTDVINYLRNFVNNYPDFDRGYLRDFYPMAHTAFDDNFHILRRMQNIILELFNFEVPVINNYLEESTSLITNAENAINNQHQILRDIHGTVDWGSVESLSNSNSSSNSSISQLYSDTNSSTHSSNTDMSN